MKKTASQEGLEDEFDKYSYSQWKNLNYRWLNDFKNYQRFKTFLFSIQIIIGGASILLGALVRNIESTPIVFTIWAVYALLLMFVNLVYRKFPDDYQELIQDIKIIKLSGVAERLAAKLALFETLSEHDVIDDQDVIEQISFRIRDYSEMTDYHKGIIRNCVNPESRFSSSRDTNITLSIEDYDLGENEKIELNNITREINETSQLLFGGSGYSVKLYLRVIKPIEKEEKIEILVPFSRFPNKENFGSSWIKSRGNLSAVWECLEKGKEHVVDFSDKNLYYKSVLFICLPGRIGVLAIQNEDNAIFNDNYSELDCKALALVTKQLVLKALGVNKN